ncbi:MAG TPA: flagellar filament capping protein FliD [Lacipirellulaceae bacterium]|nr:flagellar filament capping protein FliD [Lacipirellulaceae bacterium]
MTAITSNAGLITPSTGLITGIPIQDTVDQLMALASQSKNNLSTRTTDLTNEKTAILQLSSLVSAFQFEATQIGAAGLFTARQATSSNQAALSAAIADGKSPAPGTYVFTPVQTASAQQLLSQSFGAGETLGAGTVTFGTGGYVDAGIPLQDLNGGAGFSPGKIRITDRSGESAVIDLSFARSVDDVLDAINSNTSINVSVVANGDAFQLTDNTGGAGNLKVQEISGGTTASSLGLAGIDVASDSATGNDIFSLDSNTELLSLNDGNGVQLRSGNDLSIALADGSTVDIDLGSTKTLGDVIAAINGAAPTKLKAEIGADSNRLKLTDLTTGSGTFAISNVGEGTAATDLGLTVAASGGVITGGRLASGLRDTLLSSLDGGQGLGTLGVLDVTNRDNVTSHVDLSGTETLGQIVAAINTQAAGVTASINSARDGIVLTDTTGATTGNFVVANGDSTNTADALHVATDSSVTSVNSGGLQRQQISEATLLSSLNGGAGVDIGDFDITGTSGQIGAVDLNAIDNVATTVGDVIARINALSIGVQARINDRGDGIELFDTLHGGGQITVSEVGNGTTASDLHLLGTSSLATVDGTTTQAIDGTTTATVQIAADDTLATLVGKINALNRGVTASLLNDGTKQRLSLQSNKSGAANELLFDTSNTRLSLQEISSGRDALLQYGGSGGLLLSSASGTFNNIVDGLNVTVNDGTLQPVTVNVGASTSSLVDTANEFVSAYNSMRDTLTKLTAYDPVAQTTGLLFGTTESLQVDTNLSRLLTNSYFGLGQFQSLQAVGFTLDDKGELSLNDDKLTQAFSEDPDAVTKLFTDPDRGISATVSSAAEHLAGTNSLLSSRADALSSIIDANNKRIDQMSDSLDKQRDALLAQFNNLESVVASLKNNASVLSTFTAVPPLGSVRSSTAV